MLQSPAHTVSLPHFSECPLHRRQPSLFSTAALAPAGSRQCPTANLTPITNSLSVHARGILDASLHSLMPSAGDTPWPQFKSQSAFCPHTHWKRRAHCCRSSDSESAGTSGSDDQPQGKEDAGEKRSKDASESTSNKEASKESEGKGESSTGAEDLKATGAHSISGGSKGGNSEGSGVEDSAEISSAQTADWRAFRARLVASEHSGVRARPGDGGLGLSEAMGDGAGDTSKVSLDSLWAHALYAPEKGCLLVASELLHGYNFFQRSLILLLGAGTGPSDGPYGIALNKAFPRTVAEVDSLLPGLSSTFGDCQVHVGGPIGPRTVLLVHGHPGLDGHCEVLPGVFVAGLAGLSAATQLVESGRAAAGDFQVVLGYAGWGEEQLRQEIAQGWWYVAACSPEVVLEVQRKSAEGKGDALWKWVLDLMGGEYAEVGNRSTGEEA